MCWLPQRLEITVTCFHDIGLASADIGPRQLRYVVKSQYAFKTPGCAKSPGAAPYMHDGSIPDLENSSTTTTRAASNGTPVLN